DDRGARAARHGLRADLRRRRLHRRVLRDPRAPARLRPPRSGRSLQAQLWTASRHARRARAGARRDRGDDGRGSPKRAGGHPHARCRRPGRRRGGERPPERPPRLVGANAPIADGQRHAAALHRRADLRLRLRVQRLPPRGPGPDARGDRQAEVHEGARALGLVRLTLHVLAGFWPQPIQWIGVALGIVCTLVATALGAYGVGYWINESNFPGPLFGGVLVLYVLGIQGFILALIGEYLGRIQ